MKKKFLNLSLFSAFLIILANPVLSEMKFVVQNESKSNFYVDFETIKKKSGYVYYWSLTDYSKRKPSGTKSIKAFFELDCSLMRYKFLTDHAYDGPMGTGTVKINNKPDIDWNYHSPGSAGYYVNETVCKYADSFY